MEEMTGNERKSMEIKASKWKRNERHECNFIEMKGYRMK